MLTLSAWLTRDKSIARRFPVIYLVNPGRKTEKKADFPFTSQALERALGRVDVPYALIQNYPLGSYFR